MKYSLIIFIVVALAQLYVPAQMIFQREKVLNKGKTYKFKTQPIDPHDPFRGAYIWLNFEENHITVDTLPQWHRGETIYVELDASDGFAGVGDISKTKPLGGDAYLEAEVDFVSRHAGDSQVVYIQYPFDRYYMDEFKAKPAENIYFKSLADTTQTTYAVVNILDGRAVLQDVKIDDQSIRELVKSALSE